MSHSNGDREPAPPGRRFFLATPHDPGAPRLAPGELEHAGRVLRLQAGEECVGLDGRGGCWPLRVLRAERREVVVEAAGEPWIEPAPGESGAPLPWIELWVAWPKGGRGEELLDAATQLGVAAVRPLVCRQSGLQAPPAAGDARWRRCQRVLQSACKQSRRSWLPQLGAPGSPAELAGSGGDWRGVLLEPGAELALDSWARAAGREQGARFDAETPLVVAVGPEGGFDEAERAALVQAGLAPVRLGPHVLRIEVAATAALAVLATHWA